MKNLFKRSLASLTAMVAVFGIAGQMQQSGISSILNPVAINASAADSIVYTTTNGIEYTITNNLASVTDYTGTATSVTIPSTIKVNSKTYKVETIGMYAFYNSDIVSVDMSGTMITEVEAHAFKNCYSLKTVKFSKYLTTIGNYAFMSCRSLTSLEMPATLKEVNYRSFSYCSKLATVKFLDNKTFDYIGSYAFYGCSALTRFYFEGDAGNYNTCYLPDTGITLSEAAFKGCTGIKNLYIHDSYYAKDIVVISNAFEYSGLNVVFESEVNSNPVQFTEYNDEIVTASDGNDYKINFVDANDPSQGLIVKSVTVKKGTVTVPSSMKFRGKTYTVREIGDNFLTDNTTVTKATIGDTIKKLGAYFCTGAKNLQTLQLPSQLETIGHTSIYGCSKLTTIKYSGTKLREIGYQSLWCTKWLDDYEKNYPKADAVMLGNYIYKYLGNNYSGNTNKEITLNCLNGLATANPNTGAIVVKPIKHIGYHAFDNENSSLIKNVNMSGVQTIHDFAFANCNNLVSVYNTNSLTYVGDEIVGEKTMQKLKEETSNPNCIMMGSVLLKWIGTSSTADLRSLNVTYIPDYAFKGVTSALKTIRFNATTMPFIQEKAFISTKISTIYVGGTPFTYANVKNGTVAKDFYELNYLGLEGCPAMMSQFVNPMCKEILGTIGVTYYGKVNTNLTAAQQTRAAGLIYRYLSRKLTYHETVKEHPYYNGQNSSGEYTLYTNLGTCGPSARAYMYLLNAAGLDTNMAGSSTHGWTLVKIGNEWFHSDACDTWTHIQKRFLASTEEIKASDTAGHHNYIQSGAPDQVLVSYGILGANEGKPSCTKKMGDVNNDGVVNSTDVTKLFSTIRGSSNPVDKTYADLNGDGRVDYVDFILLEAKAKES